MAFITFEDETALYETVVFPREYWRFATVISTPGPFLVTGEVTEELGVLTVTVSNLQLLFDVQTPSNHIPEKSIWRDELAA